MAKKKKLQKISRWFKNNPKEPIEHEEVNCKNCNTAFKGNFCPECGQSIKDFDQPFTFIFYNFMGDFFSFDVRFFRTFVNLLIKPGFLTKEYFEGRRVRYAPPLRVFIFSSFILFFLLQIYTNRGLTKVLDSSLDDQITALDSLQIAAVDSASVNVQNALDTLAAEDIDLNLDLASFRDTKNLRQGLAKLADHFEEKLAVETDPEKRQDLRTYISLCNSPEQVIARLLKYLSWAFFVLLPIFALILKLFYIRRKQNYMRHLIFSIHVHSFVFVIIAIITLLYQFMTMDAGVISFVVFLCIPVYIMVALKKFYGQSKRKVFVKFIGISIFYNIIFWNVFVFVFLNALNII